MRFVSQVPAALVFVSCLGPLACATSRADNSRTLAAATALGPSQALAELRGEQGPERFAMVTPGLYRGGAPDAHDLALLRAVGVTKVIDLRRENLYSRRAERDSARALGIRYVAYPFYGVFGAELQFLDALLAELGDAGGGSVYVHCDNGRDRTGLVTALHRVVTHGWNAERAFAEEIEAYGRRRSPLFREIELTYNDYVHVHRLRVAAAHDGAARRQAIAATVQVGSGMAARPRSTGQSSLANREGDEPST